MLHLHFVKGTQEEDSLIRLQNLQKISKSVTTNLVTISDRVEVDIVVVVAKILMQI